MPCNHPYTKVPNRSRIEKVVIGIVAAGLKRAEFDVNRETPLNTLQDLRKIGLALDLETFFDTEFEDRQKGLDEAAPTDCNTVGKLIDTITENFPHFNIVQALRNWIKQ